MGLSAGMPALQYSSEALVQTEDLSSMSVEELQAELIRTRQAFHSAGAHHVSVTSADLTVHSCGNLSAPAGLSVLSYKRS